MRWLVAALLLVSLAACTRPPDTSTHEGVDAFLLTQAELPPGFNVTGSGPLAADSDPPLIPGTAPQQAWATYTWTNGSWASGREAYATLSVVNHVKVYESIRVYPSQDALDLALAQAFTPCLVPGSDTSYIRPLVKATSSPTAATGHSHVLVHGLTMVQIGTLDDILQPLPDAKYARVAQVADLVAAKSGAQPLCSLPIPTGHALAPYVANPSDAPGWAFVPASQVPHTHGMGSNPGFDSLRDDRLMFMGVLTPDGKAPPDDRAPLLQTTVDSLDPGKPVRVDGTACGTSRILTRADTYLSIAVGGVGVPAAELDAVAAHMAARLGATDVCQLPQWRSDGNDARENATALVLGLNGPFDLRRSGDVDWYQLTLDHRAVVQFNLTDGTLAPDGLRDAAGHVLHAAYAHATWTTDRFQQHEATLLTLDADPGTMTLVVDQARGAYTIRVSELPGYYVDHDNRPADATALHSGDHLAGELDSAHDWDFYSLDLPQWAWVRITGITGDARVWVLRQESDTSWVSTGDSRADRYAGTRDPASMILEAGHYDVVVLSGHGPYAFDAAWVPCHVAYQREQFCAQDATGPGGTLTLASLYYDVHGSWATTELLTGASPGQPLTNGAGCTWPVNGAWAIGDVVTCTVDGPVTLHETTTDYQLRAPFHHWYP